MNNAIATNPGLRIEIVKRSDDMKGFVALPADGSSSAPSLGSAVADTLLAFVTLAAIQLGAGRLARA